MSSRLNPYVNYDGNAREAMEFYNGVFGGKLTISTFGEYGMGEGPLADRVMHAQLETDDGFTLMASDTQPGTEHQPGNNISISLSGEDGDELHRCWDGLADGGNVTMPLEKQMWGDEFGMVVDRFGVAWMVDVVHPQEA
jgi:PhnB protein